jgi:3-phosphoshikimate 1-carboxyvinyltransferase
LQVRISGSVSSQYLTALLMAAPLSTGSAGVEIQIVDELVSQPYVDMTVKLMERFGVKVGRHFVAVCLLLGHLVCQTALQ